MWSGWWREMPFDEAIGKVEPNLFLVKLGQQVSYFIFTGHQIGFVVALYNFRAPRQSVNRQEAKRNKLMSIVNMVSSAGLISPGSCRHSGGVGESVIYDDSVGHKRMLTTCFLNKSIEDPSVNQSNRR